MSTLTPTDFVFLDEASEDAMAELIVEGRRYRLTPRALKVVVEIVDGLEAGDDVVVTRAKPLLSTQEAANLLGISRPSLVRLLDEGLIPFERPAGVHRRVTRAAIEAYLKEAPARRAAALAEMAETYAPELETEGFIETR
ncbi:excisionase family DNA-binding protein [Tessaracoccus defluvii]|uniref:Helix-turn-helix domain-containing protein n=1 Tax=Tessaracoccus defluvii TaxID=1285901 RepID=A0A7H0H4W7_9ACTN|nr:excisionase family DNA-binding protein [Tessaracoccus defluvii]QNP55583.1 helix-turn-helix domain-containing protein [Tessaracoccus defluvii]